MPHEVLLCDDEIHILRAAEIRISRAGYHVRIAHDGQEAGEAILANRPDVVVTDMNMPRCNGMELTTRIRSNPAVSDLPIIMLTARGFELPRDELVEKWGVVDSLAKPFSPRQLLALIDQVLGTARPTALQSQ
jgi:two-component system alkaline phosphatase synthesis response regulator PhoP